ncbi:hypothetical protein L0668_12030 [Paraglaciecola aquimarina]|uniref:Uncharacterized protein n=1 Tax=Paraglaciecola algarum TaxID=3050085 RepID=A0ABS9D7E5_9ALTE|nr:hypothetical protein [Paraglaciecola sp. G1-23]MCF2948839.1 hypothetical protein [Paraglaciecola sp. G1-23]
MKKILIPLLLTSTLATTVSCSAKDKLSQQSSIPSANPAASIMLDASKDFNQTNLGDVPYYQDKNNDSLAIDARVLEYRNLFAKASSTFNGLTGEYDVTFTYVTEEDGEPLYRLLVNNQVVGLYRADYIQLDKNRDLKPNTHVWKGIRLTQGDTISVESAAHTNGRIPEHGGTAWARGRWQQVEFTPVNKKQTKPKLRPHQQPKREYFSQHKDLLVAQFDSKPDADDIHAIAALGSMLAHPDLAKVNYVAVAGAFGIQDGEYIDSPELFKLAFGKENLGWTDANKNKANALSLITSRVRAVLKQGGNVWVQEAGQSDFTRDWLEALIAGGMHQSIVKNNIFVVQHSKWNETKTTPEDLAYVKQKTSYMAINDGNEAMKEFNHHGRRVFLTPMYVDPDTKWIASAVSEDNNKQHARKLWQEATNIIDKIGFDAHYSVIPKGGVDFSDTVESWWILNLGHRAPSVHGFWDRYVTSVELDSIKPPKGRIAVVIDGNSPDPDDVGATPVMFGLLNQAGLTDRLVHLSHSCDLDPFKNKGVQRIDAKNELRRQGILHQLTGEAISLFGPFKNLRNFYNCRVDQTAATQDLTDAINNSTAADPLWIIEAGEPDLIGYALELANPSARQHVKIISHHPANDNSGDYFTWQQILDFGITQYQIGDQNVGLQTPMYPWDWAKEHSNKGIAFIWKMLAYAEQDGVVAFQTNKFDCSDAGMMYWWITGADNGGNNSATADDMKDMLLR